MRVAIFQKPGTKRGFSAELKEYDLSLNQENPEIVVSYGGDGTFFLAEQRYPGIPKLLVKNSKICKKCSIGDVSHLFKYIKDRKYKTKRLPKLEVVSKGKRLVGVNDIIIRNKLPGEAVRFSVKTGKMKRDYVGDGVVISTAYGSTAYFESITRKSFSKGFGIAFNNVTEKSKPLIFDDSLKVEIRIDRGSAVVGADNIRRYFNLKDDDKVVVGKGKDYAKIIRIPEH